MTQSSPPRKKDDPARFRSQQLPKGFPGGPPCPVETRILLSKKKSNNTQRVSQAVLHSQYLNVRQTPKGFSGGPPLPVPKSPANGKGLHRRSSMPRWVTNLFVMFWVRIPWRIKSFDKSYSYFQKVIYVTITLSQKNFFNRKVLSGRTNRSNAGKISVDRITRILSHLQYPDSTKSSAKDLSKQHRNLWSVQNL